MQKTCSELFITCVSSNQSTYLNGYIITTRGVYHDPTRAIIGKMGLRNDQPILSIQDLTLAVAEAGSKAPLMVIQGDPSKACAGRRSQGALRRQHCKNQQNSGENRRSSNFGAGMSTMVWTRSMVVVAPC